MDVLPGELIFITGLSGSGKSLAMRCFEDMGYFCVDNLPSALIPVFTDLCFRSRKIPKIALVIDIREGQFLVDFPPIFQKLKNSVRNVSILFFEASNPVLRRRFSETRRPHPLAQGVRPAPTGETRPSPTESCTIRRRGGTRSRDGGPRPSIANARRSRRWNRG